MATNVSGYNESVTPSWTRTYKKPDGTPYTVAYRARTTFSRDSKDNSPPKK